MTTGQVDKKSTLYLMSVQELRVHKIKNKKYLRSF